MTQVNILVEMHISEGGADAFAEMFNAEFAARSHKEPGCLFYELWVDRKDPHRMTIVESWASQADLDRHMAQDWFKVWRPKLDAAVRIPINGRRHNATAEPGTSQS
jgi:quinol monooxygenase YgiN